jgi:hypothetical protein
MQSYAVQDFTIENFAGESAFPERYPAIQIQE